MAVSNDDEDYVRNKRGLGVNLKRGKEKDTSSRVIKDQVFDKEKSQTNGD